MFFGLLKLLKLRLVKIPVYFKFISSPNHNPSFRHQYNSINIIFKDNPF